MVGSGNLIEVEWLMACLAPRDVAPHPNFRVQEIRPAALLALLVELENADYDHYREVLDRTDATGKRTLAVDVALLAAAKAALDSDNVEVGLHQLIDISRNQTISLGKRVAAVLLAALAGSECDIIKPSLDSLKQLHDEISDPAAVTYKDTGALVRAAVAQQIAIRSLETGLYEDASGYAQRAMDSLKAQGEHWEEFSTSRGISWSAAESQRRVSLAIQSNAQALLVSTQAGVERAWEDIVRSAPPISEIRPARDAGSGLAAFLEEQFKQTFPSGSSTTTFRRSDIVLRPLYSALINAEMLGSLHWIRERREELGHVQAVRGVGTEQSGSLREAFRLLRQADADDSIRRILRHLRQAGPLSLLRETAAEILNRPPFLRISPVELAILEAAADLLSPQERATGLARVLDFPEEGCDGRLRRRRPTFKRRIELAFKAVESLTPNSLADAFVATRMVEKSGDYDVLTDQTLFGAFVRVASAINWSNVPDELRRRWVDLLDAIDITKDVLASDMFRLAQSLGRELNTESVRLRGIEGVAALVNGWISSPADADLAEASEQCSDYLDRIQRDAESGSVRGYFYSPIALASYLIIRFSRVELWPKLLTLLKHPLVAAADKATALRILMRERAPLPDDVVALVESMGDSIASFEELDTHFGASSADLDNLWHNVLLVQGIKSLASMQSELVRSTGDRDSAIRSRTAEVLSFSVRSESGSDWGIVLLLQLSHDGDSIVRHQAARGLSYIGWKGDSPVSSVVRDRVVELLMEEGISSVMGALLGFIDYAGDTTAPPRLWCINTIGALAGSHASSNVRAAASKVLQCNGVRA